MTSPSLGPSSGVASSPRALAAIGLVGYVALAEFFGFILWIADKGTFTFRSANASGIFLDLTINAMPIVAVLIAAKIAPALPLARTIVLVALIEYGVSLALGLITFLIGIGNAFDADGLHGTTSLILGLGAIALIAIAGFITFRIFTEMGGRLQGPQATYGGGGGYPPPQQPQYPPQPGQTYPTQPGQYPGAQQ